IRYNPYDTVEIRRHRPVHYKPLNGEQQRDLLVLVDRDHYRAVMKVLICTGLRIGEFLAVDFDKIDYENRYIFVDRKVDVKTGELQNYTKTESSIRKVPFLPELEKDLRAISRNVKRGQAFSYNAIKEYFQKRYQKMGIKRNIHSMRHTFVSMAYYAGIPLKTIQKIVGHATLDMTMNVYTHIINPDESPYVGYFKKLLEDVKKRPTDFWCVDTA
ncbi:MAG: site-specific integrase, partial [Clostridia bacterium]|nr:site-specific integrase [Clostridia bacterium]